MTDTGLNVTELEKKMLVSLLHCHYGDRGDWIWAWAHNDSFKPHGLSEKSVPGIIGSLVKKGLMWSDGQTGRDSCMGLTSEGQAAATELDR